ncbi:FAD-dependent oxidoreductase [Pelobium manganitolerans]|uniref:FAD-dependent oxidoreductase n=1 Tax=Pelobium manganitolerans TaxID=1842495 RepID=UPI003FA358DC
MIKRYFSAILLLFSFSAFAQYKPDVVVIGGSAAGTAAAIQAANSGVKAVLIEPGSQLIGDAVPDMDIPAFNRGIWKKWKDLYKSKIDSQKTATPQDALETLVKQTKNLHFFKNTPVLEIKQKSSGWEIRIPVNGKTEKIKCKILVDATTDSKASLLASGNILKLDSAGKFDAFVNYNKAQRENPYQQAQKLYKTSGAAGFGHDSLLHFIPLGVFIPKNVDNLLVVSMSCFKDFDTEDFRNIALWTNMGQAAGALAAYGPFFNVSPKKANIRITQNEMLDYNSFLYPVLDVDTARISWNPVQKIIASGVLRFDFVKGKFNPDSAVTVSQIKNQMTQLYPRARIWFIENSALTSLSTQNLVSMLSFISGRDPVSIQQEIENDWKKKYKFKTAYSAEKTINKLEFACILENYISPYSVNVDFAGFDLR